MSLREICTSIIRSYCLIVTGSLLCAGIVCSLFWKDAVLGVEIIWQILLSSAAASGLFFVYYSKKELSKKALMIRDIIHFILLLCLLLFCAYHFAWIHTHSLIQPFFFVGLVTAIYSVIRFVLFKREQRDARNLSRALHRFNNQEESI